jgi:IS5 family transposase
MKQTSFADAEYAGKRKQTRRERFLIEMDQVVPWKGLIAETTILNFRRLLEKHELAGEILQVINGYLGDRGLMLRQGTVVDATIIHASSSTKNKDGKRDPECTRRRCMVSPPPATQRDER